MKSLVTILFVLTGLATASVATAQSSPTPEMFVKSGIALNDSGKYDEAIQKYDQALKLDPNFQDALYEKSFTLFSSGKGNDAIPYLEKLIKINPNLGQAFDMLGSIYDDNKQPDKAIEYYLEGIKVEPAYQRLHFNIAITYYRREMYAESEKYAITAMKLDPKHASSQRVYAMATFKEKKRGCSLLAWCSFILLEPQSKRSAEAYAYIRYIIHYGIKENGDKQVNISYSPDSDPSSSLAMQLAVVAATEGKKDLSPVDSLQLQLKSLFEVAGTITGDKEDPSIKKYFADYFEQLGKTDNMPAFARLVSLMAFREENLKWFKENDKQLTALDSWVAATKREF